MTLCTLSLPHLASRKGPSSGSRRRGHSGMAAPALSTPRRPCLRQAQEQRVLGTVQTRRLPSSPRTARLDLPWTGEQAEKESHSHLFLFLSFCSFSGPRTRSCACLAPPSSRRLCTRPGCHEPQISALGTPGRPCRRMCTHTRILRSGPSPPRRRPPSLIAGSPRWGTHLHPKLRKVSCARRPRVARKWVHITNARPLLTIAPANGMYALQGFVLYLRSEGELL
ncbi:hypothetical protein DFH09DRAFT_1181288 [Mycena vulgaris]|nr:hypothetical protein DFH09DRAFT_1181288 [Mycena vulgaris]